MSDGESNSDAEKDESLSESGDMSDEEMEDELSGEGGESGEFEQESSDDDEEPPQLIPIEKKKGNTPKIVKESVQIIK